MPKVDVRYQGINSYHQSLSVLAAKGLSGGIGIRLLLGPVPTPLSLSSFLFLCRYLSSLRLVKTIVGERRKTRSIQSFHCTKKIGASGKRKKKR